MNKRPLGGLMLHRYEVIRPCVGFRVEHVTNAGREPAYIPYLVVSGPNSKFSFLLQIEGRFQGENKGLFVDLSAISRKETAITKINLALGTFISTWLGGSVIYAASRDFNLMLETVGEWAETVNGDGGIDREFSAVISPASVTPSISSTTRNWLSAWLRRSDSPAPRPITACFLRVV